MTSKSSESFACKFCPQVLRFTSHLKEHGHQKHNFCIECDIKYKTRDEIIEHLTNHHGQKLRCEFCQYHSLRQREIQVHINKMHLKIDGNSSKKSPPKKRKLSDCGTEEKSPKKVAAFEFVECKFCLHKFRFMSQLREHYNQRH